MSLITASAKLLEPVFLLAEHYRMDPAMLLNYAQLSTEEFAKPGARFPAAYFSHVLQALGHASDNPRVALNLGEATQPRLLGSIGFIMSTAPTLDKAYQAMVDYFPLLFGGAVLQMEQTVEGTLLTIEMSQPELQTIEYFLACLVNWPRWLTGQPIVIDQVRLTFAEPEEIQPYQRFFDARIEFNSPCNQILFNSQYLNLRCLEANAEMHQLHRQFADSLLSRSNQQSAIIAQTRHLIRQQLHEGGGSVRRDQIANSVGLSLRTLQRKLGGLGTSFQNIYDLTRREVSLQHIQRGELSLGEIAFQLGFSNQSAFQKAFKRWMGVPPSVYRQQISPVVFPDPVPSPIQPPINTEWLKKENAEIQLHEQTALLNMPSVELLKLADPKNDASIIQQNGTTISALLQHSCQVIHWFSPIENSLSQLQSVDQMATEQCQWLIQSECRLLQHQLLFFSTTPINKQLVRCREDHQLMINHAQPFQATLLRDSTLMLLEILCDDQPFPSTIQYQHGWQAVSTIIGALLLDKQSHWPMMCSWEPLLENQLAGYFCVTEAIFCTAMMRLILAQQQHVLGRLHRNEIEQIESRMELWAKHCPDNFKGQWLLLQAEKARLEEQRSNFENKRYQKPSILFEQALKATDIHAFGFHRAFCYERYADYLFSQEQLRLAHFCLSEARDLYQKWGASAKVNQLRRSHMLNEIEK